MALSQTTFQQDGLAYDIVCEDAAGGLEGVDGKAWLFTVAERNSGRRADVVAGVAMPLLETWHANHGAEIANEDLIDLLTDRVKADIAKGQIDLSTDDLAADSNIRDILTADNAAVDFAEERQSLANVNRSAYS